MGRATILNDNTTVAEVQGVQAVAVTNNRCDTGHSDICEALARNNSLRSEPANADMCLFPTTDSPSNGATSATVS